MTQPMPPDFVAPEVRPAAAPAGSAEVPSGPASTGQPTATSPNTGTR
jgi:hypothetical protein